VQAAGPAGDVGLVVAAATGAGNASLAINSVVSSVVSASPAMHEWIQIWRQVCF
jgi:hypothetical protein